MSCSAGGASVGTIEVSLATGPYTAVSSSTTFVPWADLTADNAYQGSIAAPNLCAGGLMYSSSTIGCVRFRAEIQASTGQASAYQLSYQFRYRVPATASPTSPVTGTGSFTATSSQVTSSLFSSGSYAATNQQWLVTSAAAEVPASTFITAQSTGSQTATLSAAAATTVSGASMTLTRNPNCLNSDPLATNACCKSAAYSATFKMFPVPQFCQMDNPRNWKYSGNPGLGGPCETLSDTAGCTAKDVKIAQLRNTGAARSCTVGEIITITLRATFVGTSQTRYNVAAYFAVDGGNANCGKCFPFNLSPVDLVSNTVNVCNDAAINCTGPFRNYDRDACGDLLQNELTLEDRQMEFVCRDADSNGQADLQACLTWDNQGGDGTCQSIQGSPAGTTSKCNCDPVNIIGLNVCVGDQLQCRGNDRAVNTLPCQPTFSSRVKITASAVSTQFPPSTVLYGNMFFDFQTKTIRYAIQYFDPSPAIMPAQFNTSSPAVIREDILFPCKTIARTQCTPTGGSPSCTASFNSNQIPRLFHEGNYTIDATISALTPDSTDCSQAPSTGITLHVDVECFKKTNRLTDPPSAISYIWTCSKRTCGANADGIYEVQVAVAKDGSVWELFSLNGTSGLRRGVVIATPVSPCTVTNLQACPAWNAPSDYNFTKFDTSTCSNVRCNTQVENVFVVDEQAGIGATDFTTYVKRYLYDTLNGFYTLGSSYPNASFGFAWSNSSGTGYEITVVLKKISDFFFRPPVAEFLNFILLRLDLWTTVLHLFKTRYRISLRRTLLVALLAEVLLIGADS